MTLRRKIVSFLCVAALACGVASAADANDIAAAAKAVFDKHAASVVTIKVVTSVKVTYQGREMPTRESESEVLGSVLNETGLIVVSNTAADPARARGPSRPGLTVDSELKATKLIRKDGTELALKIVLRDKDLDLMFLRPEKKLALPHLDVKQKGPELAIAERIIMLSRLEAVGDRQPSVLLSSVEAVIDKPRRFYVTSLGNSMRSLGCPVFTAGGELVGIVTIRMNRGGRIGMLPTILPIKDVLEGVQQIKELDAENAEDAKDEKAGNAPKVEKKPAAKEAKKK